MGRAFRGAKTQPGGTPYKCSENQENRPSLVLGAQRAVLLRKVVESQASAPDRDATKPTRCRVRLQVGQLELSDDEDHHPGAQFIEENTLRRIKREAHENKEKERAEKIESLEKQIRKNERKIKELSEGENAAANEAEIAKLRSANSTFQSEVDTERRQKSSTPRRP